MDDEPSEMPKSMIIDKMYYLYKISDKDSKHIIKLIRFLTNKKIRFHRRA